MTSVVKVILVCRSKEAGLWLTLYIITMLLLRCSGPWLLFFDDYSPACVLLLAYYRK